MNGYANYIKVTLFYPSWGKRIVVMMKLSFLALLNLFADRRATRRKIKEIEKQDKNSN